MNINKLSKDLLYCLNLEASKQNINYALNYQYRFYETTQMLRCAISLLKFEKKKIKERIYLKNQYELIDYLSNELKQYEK